MGDAISGVAGPVLGLRSSLDMYEKLKYESSRLQDGWHAYDSFNFIVTAWHLFHDWPKSDAIGSLSRKKRCRAELPEQMNLVLNVVQDLANGSKHFELWPRSEGRKRITEVHSGKTGGWYSYLFHERLPAVTVDQHWYFSIRVLTNIVIGYFDWVFDDESPLSVFPREVLEAIDYCNIANRKGATPPDLWLRGTPAKRSGPQ